MPLPQPSGLSRVESVGDGSSVVRVALRVMPVWCGLAIAAASITVLFLDMRSVMEIGGFCAGGGPYVIAATCPKGAAWITPVSISVGLLGLAVYTVASIRLPGPRWTLLAWPALFLSLGWNFWEFGLNPDEASGVAVGWIVCGVLFVAMGAVPLVGLLASSTGRKLLTWADAMSSSERLSARATAASASPPAARPDHRTVRERRGQAVVGATRIVPNSAGVKLLALAVNVSAVVAGIVGGIWFFERFS